MNLKTINSTHSPLVSIGIPVYNGERFLVKALNSLVNQSLWNFEIIISDNASTDNTRAICEDFESRDSRIRYIRQKSNIGAPRNWNAVVHEASGAFFKWASASDYCEPTMLERCVKELLTDPMIILCYGRTQLIDENEQPIEIYEGDESFDEDRPSERFMRVISKLSLNNAQCGLFRLDVLRQTRLDRPYPSGDMALMAELSLFGKFLLVPDVLHFRRQSRDSFTSMLSPLELQRVYDPKAKTPIKIIHARRHLDHFVSITSAPISLAEKLRAYQVALRDLRWDRKLRKELLLLFESSSSNL